MITTRYELTVPAMLERAEQGFPERDIVSRTPAGIFRYTYREFAHRVGKLASALVAWGVRKGDRVATLAWNHHRHLEACFAAPAIGAVLHPLNHQLPPAQLAQTINHAADKVVIADADLLPRLESVAPSLDTVERYIIMSDGPEVQARLANATSYEALIGPADTPMAGIRRVARGGRLLLHGCRRAPKRGCVYLSRFVAGHPGLLPRGSDWCNRARYDPHRGAIVPCQCLGAPICGRLDGEQAGAAGPTSRREGVL